MQQRASRKMDKGTEGFWTREVSLSLIDFRDLMHLCVRRMKIADPALHDEIK